MQGQAAVPRWELGATNFSRSSKLVANDDTITPGEVVDRCVDL